MADTDVIDFEKAEECPTGELALECVKAVVGVSGAGNVKIDLHWKIVAADEPAFVGRMVFDTLTLTSKSAFRTVQAARAAQVKLPKQVTATKESAELIAELFVGASVTAAVIAEVGQGEYADRPPRPKINKYIA